MSQKPIQKIAIVEDADDVREQLVELLNQTDGFQCVGAFASAEEGLREIPELNPAVVLMDIHLPRMSGIECVLRLKKMMPGLRVLMLTAFEESDKIFRALRAGADGYLVKRDTPEKLIEAIKDLNEGGSPMSSHIARKVVQHFHIFGPQASEADKLSFREQEILQLLVAGNYYKEIAEQLGIGLETVKTHVQHIFAKLHVRTRSEAVAKFLKA